jgi:hypothetical protein
MVLQRRHGKGNAEGAALKGTVLLRDLDGCA